eukprot:gene23095-27948_t
MSDPSSENVLATTSFESMQMAAASNLEAKIDSSEKESAKPSSDTLLNSDGTESTKVMSAMKDAANLNEEQIQQVQVHFRELQSQTHVLQQLVQRQVELSGQNPLRQEMLQAAVHHPVQDLDPKSTPHNPRSLSSAAPEESLSRAMEDLLLEEFAIKDKLSVVEASKLAQRLGLDARQVLNFFERMQRRVRLFMQHLPPTDVERSVDTTDSVPTSAASTALKPLVLPSGGLQGLAVIPAFMAAITQAHTIGERTLMLQAIMQTSQLNLLSALVDSSLLKVLNDWVLQAHRERSTTLLLQLLRALKHLPVTYAALQSSLIGRSVNQLQRFPQAKVQIPAKVVVDTWRKLAERSLPAAQSVGEKAAVALAPALARATSTDLASDTAARGSAVRKPSIMPDYVMARMEKK